MPFGWFVQYLAGKAYKGLSGWEESGKGLTVLPKTPGYQVGASWNAASYAGASQPQITTETTVKKDSNVFLYIVIGIIFFLVVLMIIASR